MMPNYQDHSGIMLLDVTTTALEYVISLSSNNSVETPPLNPVQVDLSGQAQVEGVVPLLSDLLHQPDERHYGRDNDTGASVWGQLESGGWEGGSDVCGGGQARWEAGGVVLDCDEGGALGTPNRNGATAAAPVGGQRGGGDQRCGGCQGVGVVQGDVCDQGGAGSQSGNGGGALCGNVVAAPAPGGNGGGPPAPGGGGPPAPGGGGAPAPGGYVGGPPAPGGNGGGAPAPGGNGGGPPVPGGNGGEESVGVTITTETWELMVSGGDGSAASVIWTFKGLGRRREN